MCHSTLGFPVVAYVCLRYVGSEIGAEIGRAFGESRRLWLPAALLVTFAVDLLQTYVLRWDGSMSERLPMSMSMSLSVVDALSLLAANGLLAPLAEELVWRGGFQRLHAQSHGLKQAWLVVAALFTLKHVLLDFSLHRVGDLALIAFALGWLQMKWGLKASLLAHIALNLSATFVYVLVATGVWNV